MMRELGDRLNEGKVLNVLGLLEWDMANYQAAIDTFASASAIGEEIGDERQAGQQGGFVGQEVVTAGKLRLNRAVVSHEIAMAQRQWEIQWLRVTNDVRAAACEVIAAQRTVELDRQLLLSAHL